MHGTAIIIVHAGWLAGWCSGCMVQQSSWCMLAGWLVQQTVK